MIHLDTEACTFGWCVSRQSVVGEDWALKEDTPKPFNPVPCCDSRPESYKGEPPVDRGCGYMQLVPLDARVVGSPEDAIKYLVEQGAIESVRLDYAATDAFKSLLDDPEERCPSCGSDEHDDHVDGCERIDTCGQFGPPWLDPPWHPLPDIRRGNDESLAAWEVRASEWSREIREHARTHALNDTETP